MRSTHHALTVPRTPRSAPRSCRTRSTCTARRLATCSAAWTTARALRRSSRRRSASTRCRCATWSSRLSSCASSCRPRTRRPPRPWLPHTTPLPPPRLRRRPLPCPTVLMPAGSWPVSLPRRLSRRISLWASTEGRRRRRRLPRRRRRRSWAPTANSCRHRLHRRSWALVRPCVDLLCTLSIIIVISLRVLTITMPPPPLSLSMLHSAHGQGLHRRPA